MFRVTGVNVRKLTDLLFFTVCFKIFDADRDGVLNKAELEVMCRCLIEVKGQTKEDQQMVCNKKGLIKIE